MKNNNIVKIYLVGGLGNNLFQIFYASLLKKNGYQVILFDNLLYSSFFTKIMGWTIHDSELHHFNIEFDIKKNPIIYFIMDFFRLFISRIILKPFLGANYSSDFNDNLDLFSDPFKLQSGYFQEHKYLKIDELKEFAKSCSIKNDTKSKENNEEKAAIHIRGGDKSETNFIFTFYNKCIVNLKNKKSFIYTNDKIFAKSILENIKKDNKDFIFSNNNKAIEDFISIAKSSEIICADSTFSFWAAIYSDANQIFMPLHSEILENKVLKQDLASNNYFFLI